jgi:ABC-type uncharacterized transport system permease subunit
MNHPILRILPVFLFLTVAGLAIYQNRDYTEAAIWTCFALAVLAPQIPGRVPSQQDWRRYVALVFFIAGIVLLVLRFTGILPVPVRPLP